MPERSRSVKNRPGSKPLIVTLYLATCRAMPAQKAVNFLCTAQKDSPIASGKWGWRYVTPQDVNDRRSDYADDKSFQAELHDADTSVTGRSVSTKTEPVW